MPTLKTYLAGLNIRTGPILKEFLEFYFSMLLHSKKMMVATFIGTFIAPVILIDALVALSKGYGTIARFVQAILNLGPLIVKIKDFIIQLF